MPRSDASVTIDAPPQRVWDVLVDVASWPRWTESMTSVERLESGPLRVSSSARVVQPKLRPMVWTVTELVPLESFTWTARTAGMTLTGTHVIRAEGEGRTRLELAAESGGPLARVADLLLGSRVQHYVELEAAGMKAAAEAG